MEDLSEQLLAKTFPTTPEEFDRVEILSTKLVRIDLVRWMDEMVETHICKRHWDREKFLFFTETMRSSFSNTHDLYKIQAMKNPDKKIHISVLPGDVYYDILFKAHEFWTAITIEFQNIFRRYNMSNQHKFIFEIPTNPLSETAVLIIQSIVLNKNLMKVMIQLQENSATMLGHIQS